MKSNAPFFTNLKRNMKTFIDIDPEIKISFKHGARVDVVGYTNKRYVIEFWDEKKNELVYYTEIGSGEFAEPNRKYYTKWNVKVFLKD